MGFMDACVNGHGTDHVSQDFVNQCKARGMSPIYFGGNDGTSTAGGGDPAQVYQMLANMGYDAAGGESTGAQEEIIAQEYIAFLNAGGEGLQPNQDSFGNLGFTANGKYGVISYIESYNFPATFVHDDCLNAMIHAAKVGCREVGIMIGAWMPVQSDIYLQLASDFVSAGYRFGGFHLWWGIGTSMSATVQKWADAIKEMQVPWPADMRDLKTRLGGATPTPTPGPKVTLASEIFQITNNGTTDKFVIGSDKALWWKRNTSPWVSLGGIAFPGTMPMAAYVNGVLEVHVIGVTPIGTMGADWVRRFTGLPNAAVPTSSWTPWAQDELNLN